ncbi:peptidase M14 [Bacteroidia bacterium]|nr:peptidase M14 [Bacteroidia bacterium]
MNFKLSSIVLGLLLPLCLLAQPKQEAFSTELSYYMPKEWNYTLNKEIPTPQEVLGFQLGEQHVNWSQVEQYMHILEKLSPRITIKEYGRTYEHRAYLNLTITSEKNQKSIEDIRTTHNKLIDPSVSGSLDIKSMPVVINLMNTIHGNEASGVNASIGFAYFFAAAQGAEIDELLDKVLINLIPSQNPDGMNRYAAWVNANRSFPDVPDPLSREASEPWPGGRSNHYWHDLNRDWLPVQQPELKFQMKLYHEWSPNVVDDFHEMGGNSTYFLEPSDPVCYYPAIPEENKQLTAQISSYNMKALDRIGSLYLSKDQFDSYYLGTGDVYGDALGAVAMLFEQASVRGHIKKTDNGLISFPFSIRNQITCAFGTVKGAYEMKDKLLDYQRRFCADRYKEAGSLTEKAWIFDGNGSEAISYHFIELLRSHNLDVSKLAKDLTQNGHTYSKDNSYIVPVQQRNSMILRSLFESITYFKDSLFYDVSTWNMAEAFNLKYTSVKSMAGLIGDAVTQPVFKPGSVKGGVSEYAYLFDNKEYYSPLLVKSLQEAGLLVKVSGRGANSADGTVVYGPGMYVLPVANQKLSAKEIYDKVEKLAIETGVNVQAVASSQMKDFDLGHFDNQALKEPKIAILTGTGMSTGQSGSIWYLLNYRLKMKPVLLDQATLSSADLNEFNVIIIPSGRVSLSNGLDTKIAGWVRNGGTLIASGSAYKAVNELKLTELKEKKLTSADSATYIPYGERADRAAMYSIPGSHLRAQIDSTHPIAWGYTSRFLPVLKDNELAFEKPKEVNKAPVLYDKNPVLSGFLRKEHSKELEDTPIVICDRAGTGHIIYITDDLTFRSYWYGGARMFTNAIFFAPLIR